MWAERYDRVQEDIFDLQEELTRGIAGAIAPHILVAETDLARRLRPGNLRSYELALRAWAMANDALLTTDVRLWEKSIEAARQVIALDPRNTTALSTVAVMQWMYLFLTPGDMSTAKARLHEGLAAAARIVELDPLDSTGHAKLAALLSLAGRHAEALTSARRAHDLNPGDAYVALFQSYVEITAGHPEGGLESARRAIRLSPRDPFLYFIHTCFATAYFFLRDHARGLEHALQATAAVPNVVLAHVNLLQCAVGVGDLETAKAALSAVRRLSPTLADRMVSKPPDAFHRQEDRDRLLLAYRIAAGLEVPSAAQMLR